SRRWRAWSTWRPGERLQTRRGRGRGRGRRRCGALGSSPLRKHESPGQSPPDDLASGLNANAGPGFAELEQLLGERGVVGPRPDAVRSEGVRVGRDGRGDVDVLAVDAAFSVELRTGGAPDARGRALLGALEARNLLDALDRGAPLLLGHEAHEVG